MAYSNAVVIKAHLKTIGTSAASLQSGTVSQLVASFTLESNSANTGVIYIGGADVDATVCLHLAAGDTYSPPVLEMRGDYLEYDLSGVYARASAAGQKLSIVSVVRGRQA